jgi:hypothetical protein
MQTLSFGWELRLIGLLALPLVACAAEDSAKPDASGTGGSTSTVATATTTGGAGRSSSAVGTGGTSAGQGGNAGSSATSTELSVCRATTISCTTPRPNCSSTQNPSVSRFPELTTDGTCYTGRCIPIEQCACTEASDCPDNDNYTCWLSEKHCGPYIE